MDFSFIQKALTKPIDQYCERIGIGLLAEPLNLFSNLAFVIVAYISWRAFKKLDLNDKVLKKDMKYLTRLVALVGFGSGLFHSFANAWSMVMDVVPIIAFLLLYLYLYLNRIVSLSVKGSFIGLFGFLLLSLVIALMPFLPDLNGSEFYLGTLVTLLAITFREKDYLRLHYLLATLCFVLALTARVVDESICQATAGVGSHFLWHAFNSVLIFYVLRAYLLQWSKP